tara:strand:+ start:279 stop:566 length:288 start_codon:yes stop_codon:yes gene_type:complete
MFSHKNVNRKKILNFLKQGQKQKQVITNNRRDENYNNMVQEWKSKKTFDLKTLGNTKKKTMNESKKGLFNRRDIYLEEIENELQHIIEELENDIN